jgi:hypothetical protein
MNHTGIIKKFIKDELHLSQQSIPLCGIKNIGGFFNIDRIILLDDNFDINSLSFELYESKMDAIIDNFNRAVNFTIAEDYIYKTYIEGK